MIQIHFKKYLLYFFSIFSFSTIFSVIDYLDTTFGPDANGIVKTTIDDFAIVNGVAINSSGKIIAAGSNFIGNDQNAVVAKYNADGTLDSSFTNSGIFKSTLGSSSAFANAVTVDGSNNIFITGGDGSNNLIVAKLSTNGTLDSGFGSGGVATLTIGAAAPGRAIVIDGNGKIVVAGSAVIGGQVNLFVARFNTDGTSDTSFNSGGTPGYHAVTGSSHYTGNSLRIDQNAKIVAGGSASTLTGIDFLLIRFNADGTKDTGFGTSGEVITPISSSANDSIQSVLIDSSNKIIAAGYTTDGEGNTQFALARYSNSGTLDTTFGEDETGIVTTAIGINSQINSALIDSSSNIVATGFSDSKFTIARYDSNGSLDSTFGVSGIITTEVSSEDNRSSASALQTSDGRVISGGYNITDVNSGDSEFVLIRYNKNNTDFVNITSIADNGTINTKIPEVSGTSNGTTSPQATVQVVVNGVTLTTVNTNGSGDLNAGRTNALPIGANTIRANLIISGNTVVSHVAKFTVTDNLSEDALFAYNSTSQTKTASTFSTLPFDNILLGTLTSPTVGTWTYSSNVFTCGKTGRYVIEYVGHSGATTVSTATAINISGMVAINGTEYVGSETNSNVDISNGTSRVLSKTFIKDLTAGDTLSLNYAVNGNAGTPTAGFIVNAGTTGTQHAYTLAITRIG